MTLRDKLEAHLRGEVSTGDLASYASANSDAYDLLDGLPPEGGARLAAWCAFVLQTHADNLVSSGSAPGFCEQEAYDEARILYELVAGWLERAHGATTSGDWRLDVIVPAPYPRQHGPQGRAEVEAMRKTLETVQARAGVDLEARKGDPIYARLSPTLAAAQSALDSAIGLAAGHSPRPELQATLAQTLLGGLDRAYQAGQLLARPDLLARAHAAEPPGAGSPGPAALRLFLPGDPGFDPWCLTDPVERSARHDDGVSAGQLAELWQNDPDPGATLAIQADIAAALEAGSVDYLPADLGGSLHAVSGRRPWPGAMYVHAQAGAVIGGQQLDEGDRFILAVGGSGETFQRAIVRLSAKAAKKLTDEDEERIADPSWAGGGGLSLSEDVFSGLDGPNGLVTLGFDVLGLWP